MSRNILPKEPCRFHTMIMSFGTYWPVLMTSGFPLVQFARIGRLWEFLLLVLGCMEKTILQLPYRFQMVSNYQWISSGAYRHVRESMSLAWRRVCWTIRRAKAPFFMWGAQRIYASAFRTIFEHQCRAPLHLHLSESIMSTFVTHFFLMDGKVAKKNFTIASSIPMALRPSVTRSVHRSIMKK